MLLLICCHCESLTVEERPEADARFGLAKAQLCRCGSVQEDDFSWYSLMSQLLFINIFQNIRVFVFSLCIC